MSDTQTRLDDLRGDIGAFVEAEPELESFLGFVEDAEADGVLDARTKELVSLAVAVAVRCDPCVLWHTDAAMAAGATTEEIREALAVSVVMGGGPALAYAAKAYRVHQDLAE